MTFTYDNYKRLKTPTIYLANPNQEYFGILHARNLENDIFLNSISSATFRVNKYENDVATPNYDNVEVAMLIEVLGIGWFQITSCPETIDGKNKYKEVRALSLETEATTKELTSFGQLGLITDEDGGLDRYYLANPFDPEHSILHLCVEKMPSWKIGHIDIEITTGQRTFTDDAVDIYSFLTGIVSETFECIFIFNTYEKTINAYHLDNIGINTNIFLSLRNLINEIKIDSNFDDIKTCMNIYGGDDRGSTLNIIEVNPSGNSQLTDFSYYKKFMSEGLRSKLDLYTIEYSNRVNNFTPAITRLQELYAELNELKVRLPEKPDSVNWSEYGLAELQTKYDSYENILGTYLGRTDAISKANHNTNYKILYGSSPSDITSVKYNLDIRKLEVASKENEIEMQQLLCSSYTLDIADYLTKEEYSELSRYIHETSFTDATFIATDAMTNDEILEMKKELMNVAFRKLQKISRPQFTYSIDAINFTEIPQFREFTEQLKLGDIVTIDCGDDIFVESRLLKIHLNWDDRDDFSLTFSSKDRLSDKWSDFAEIQEQAKAVAGEAIISKTGWNIAKKSTSTVREFMNSAFNTSLNKLQSGKNIEIEITDAGIRGKRWLEEVNNYSPREMWLTNNLLCFSDDSFRSVQLALGEIEFNNQLLYGLVANAIIGQMVITEKLHVSNENNTFTVDENGAFLEDAEFIITKGNNTIKLNPDDGFTILKGSDRVIYLDIEGNANFKGNITASKITLTSAEGLTINNGNGTFTVSADGHVHAESGDIAGFTMEDNVLWAGSGKHYIRISPDHTYINDDYAAIDLGLSGIINPSTGMQDTIIHLRSDGYARFGLNSLEGSVKFNHENTDFQGNPNTFTFFTKNFRIGNDGLVTSTGINLRNGSPIRGYDTSGIEHNLVNFSPNNNVVIGEQNDPQNTHIYGLDEIALYIGSGNNKAFIMKQDVFDMKLPLELTGDLTMKGKAKITGNTEITGTLSTTSDITMGGKVVATKPDLDSLETEYLAEINYWKGQYNTKVSELNSMTTSRDSWRDAYYNYQCPPCPECPECP